MLDFNPSKSMSFFIDFLISKNIKIKKNKRKTILLINRYCKFFSFNSTKLLSIKVKNVKKPTNNVIKNINAIKIFFLIKSIIIKNFNYLN